MGITPYARLVAVLAAAPFLIQDRAPRDTAPAPPVGTSRISGQVVAADNGSPVKRATVSMPSMDHDALEKLRQHAVIATVTVGATASVQLRALKSF